MQQNESVTNSYPHLFRLLHWVLSVSLFVLVVTGLSSHASARPEWSVFSGMVPAWLLHGRVHYWHFWAGVVFVPSIVAVVVVELRRGFWQRPTQVLLLGGGIVSTITGLMLMYPFGPITVGKVAIGIHATFGLVLIPLGFVSHTFAGLTKFLRSLVPSFRPFQSFRWLHLAGFAVLGLLTTWVMFEGWPLQPSWRNLRAARIETSEGKAPDPTALPWDKATPLAIRLAGGKGFQSGQTDMTLRALHNGDELFVLAQWDDPKADFGYWPWLKTTDGWEYLQTNAKDETVHYEDKFSLAFPIEPSWQFERGGCTIYCHVDGDHGWGYKGGYPKIDVWHWKSARTSSVGQVDDKYWREVDLEAKNVGRHADPSDGGGFAKNVAEGTPHPLFLPDTPDAVHRGTIPTEHAVPYTEEAARLMAPGTIIPGLISEQFKGDRASVSSISTHQDGVWTLYMRRKLDTGSDCDAAFAPGGTYPFGCAAFDCAAKRHAHNRPVFWLVVEP